MGLPEGSEWLSLARRLILLVLPVPALFAAANFWWLMHLQTTLLREQEAQRARTLAASLASNCALALETGNPAQMQASLNALFVERDILSLEVIGADGRYLAHHDPSCDGQQASAAVADDDSRLTATAAAGSAVRVRLGLSLGEMQALVAAQQRQFLGLSLGLLGFATLGVVTLAHRFVRPLEALAGTARQITAGSLLAPTPVRARTYELQVLSQAFGDLSGRLAEAFEQEQARHRRLQREVSALLDFQLAVASGELERPVPGLEEHELAQLAGAFEGMAAALRTHRQAEHASAAQLAEFNAALQETHHLLRETDRYRTEFLSVVSHELRTPLTAVKAFAEILLDDPPDEPERRAEFVGIIYTESDRLTRIINHLLDISRIEAGRMKWSVGEVSLIGLVHEALQDLLETTHGVTFEVREGGAGLVRADGEKLAESIAALLKNAVQHSPEGEVVRVEVLPGEGGLWQVTVADRGPGVPPDQHELIFSKFQQVRVGVPQPRGTGLSLALARAVVEAQGGTLHVESDGRLGSRFVLRMPAP